jgi:hypothetical protein
VGRGVSGRQDGYNKCSKPHRRCRASGGGGKVAPEKSVGQASDFDMSELMGTWDKRGQVVKTTLAQRVSNVNSRERTVASVLLFPCFYAAHFNSIRRSLLTSTRRRTIVKIDPRSENENKAIQTIRYHVCLHATATSMEPTDNARAYYTEETTTTVPTTWNQKWIWNLYFMHHVLPFTDPQIDSGAEPRSEQ